MTRSNDLRLRLRILAGAALPALLAAPAVAAPSPALLPARTLSCTLGHATNIDTSKDQKADEIVYDSHHTLSLFLPAAAPRTDPIPDAVEPDRPVDPATRVLSDPDGLTAEAQGGFTRVVDLWPERVEMVKPVPNGTSKLFIITDFDAASSTAHLFLTTAQDLATFDMKRIYIGDCTVALSEPRAKSRTAGRSAPRG